MGMEEKFVKNTILFWQKKGYITKSSSKENIYHVQRENGDKRRNGMIIIIMMMIMMMMMVIKNKEMKLNAYLLNCFIYYGKS